MKFQDDISNMNTYIRTYIHTDKPKPICPLLFQSLGHNKRKKSSWNVHTYIHTDKPKPICPLLFQSWGHNYGTRELDTNLL